MWRVGLRTIGETAAGVAASLLWIWPPLAVYTLVHQPGFYASNLVYCGLVILLALRVVERPDRLRAGLFSFVLGLAFWETAQIVPIAAGVIAWTIWKAPRWLRHVWVIVPCAALGALPWIAWNATHGWASLDLGGGEADYWHAFRLLVSPVVPMMLGLRAPFSADALLPGGLIHLVYAGLIGLFAYGAVRTRRRPVSLLYLVASVFPFVYGISPKTSYSGEPRYILVLAPVLALLLAQFATTYARAVALLALALAVTTVTLHRMNVWFESVPSQTTHAHGLGPRHIHQWVPRDLGPLISTLDRLGLDHVYADYWIAYRLAFDTGERIVATESRFNDVRFEDGQAVPVDEDSPRFAAYAREVRAAPHGFVFYEQTVDSVPIVAELERRGYRPHAVEGFVVYSLAGAASASRKAG